MIRHGCFPYMAPCPCSSSNGSSNALWSSPWSSEGLEPEAGQRKIIVGSLRCIAFAEPCCNFSLKEDRQITSLFSRYWHHRSPQHLFLRGLCHDVTPWLSRCPSSMAPRQVPRKRPPGSLPGRGEGRAMQWNRRRWSLGTKPFGSILRHFKPSFNVFCIPHEDETSVEKLRGIRVAIFVVSTTGQGTSKPSSQCA